jgi:hypothetical protein
MQSESLQEEIWVCRDGRRLRVGEMSLEHLQNTLRLLIRTHRKNRELAASLKTLSEMYGDEGARGPSGTDA